MSGGLTYFTYSPSQWAKIKFVVSDMRGVNDVDQIGRGGESLRDMIEIEASMYIARGEHGVISRRAVARQARVDKLIALRSNAENLRDSIVASPEIMIGGVADANMLNATEAYISKLTRLIEIEIAVGLPVRPTRNANPNREELWSELLAIWRAIGGLDTGMDTAEFLIAASSPVIAKAPAKMPNVFSILRWLERKLPTFGP